MLKIDLGLESSTHVVASDFNALDAYGEVVAATEAAEKNGMQLDMLQMTAANIERGNTLAMAVADATGDQSVAVTVGAESFSMAMGMIGHGEAGQVFAGTESVTAGMEGVADMAKKVMDTMKKYAKKALEFARELLVKVMNFLKGLFGKKEDTAEAILQLVKDAKNDGRIKLDTDEFGKAVQERLAKEIPVVLAMHSGKTISGSVIEDFIDGMKVSNDAVDDNVIDGYDPAKISDKYDAGFDESGDVKDDKTGLNTNVSAIKSVIIDIVATEDMLTKGGAKYSNETTKQDIESLDSTELDSLVNDNFSVDFIELNRTPSKISFIAEVVSDEASEQWGNLNSDKVLNIKGEELKSLGELKTLVGKILSGVSVVSKTISLENKDYKDEMENVKPLEVSECLAIAKKLKENGKDVDKTLKNIEKKVKAFEKTIETANSAYEKANIDKNDDKVSKLSNQINFEIYKKSASLGVEIIRATSTGNASVATELGRSKFGHIVKESARLWKKK